MARIKLHQDFINDFEALLEKYKAEFEMDWDDSTRYSSPLIVFNKTRLEDGTIRELSNLNLDTY